MHWEETERETRAHSLTLHRQVLLCIHCRENKKKTTLVENCLTELRGELYFECLETPKYGWKEYYSCVMTVTSEHLRDLWKQFRRRDMLR
ncbi:hypothetical protein QYF61_001008 [Mycteria americana]|uniref:Uncharacterized protein n=1 Tax=Mycteria americana TaxID=33587 RepID=A0AAN7S353_MYCAM|nr:hypothetical protein QYF61_001008 [Mycteria americana]